MQLATWFPSYTTLQSVHWGFPSLAARFCEGVEGWLEKVGKLMAKVAGTRLIKSGSRREIGRILVKGG